MEIDIYMDSLTECLVCSATGDELDTEYLLIARTITRQDAVKLMEDGGKFEWSVSHQNGYEVYELLLKESDEVQGMKDITIIGVDAGSSDNRTTKILVDVFYDSIRSTKVGLSIDIKAILVFMTDKSFGFLEKIANTRFQ